MTDPDPTLDPADLKAPHGPVADDPAFQAAGDWTTVDGLLAWGKVADSPVADQRALVARLWADPDLQPVLGPLGSDLVARGLL